VDRLPEAAEVENRVRDKLARPVESDVAAALRLMHRRPRRRNLLWRREHVGRRLLHAAEREDGRMLEQQQRVPAHAGAHLRGERALQRLRRGVADAAEPMHGDRSHSQMMDDRRVPAPRR